jgi:hypothetical protein
MAQLGHEALPCTTEDWTRPPGDEVHCRPVMRRSAGVRGGVNPVRQILGGAGLQAHSFGATSHSTSATKSDGVLATHASSRALCRQEIRDD